MFERWRNPGQNTYDGTKMLAELSGLSVDEVRWTATRMKDLMAGGKSATEARNIVRQEAAKRPWIKLPQPDEWR